MTIYDIAKLAGVSAGTVSRVVNNKPGVGAEKRAIIQAILDENNYIPNQAARGLVMQSTRIVGVLIEDMRLSHHTDSLYVIEQGLMNHGYTCIAMSTGKDIGRKMECMEILEQRRVEGIIMIGSMFCDPQIENWLKEHLTETPVIIVNGYLELPNVYGILVNEKEGVSDCVRLLAERARNNLYFVKDSQSPSNDLKQKGFEEGMRDYLGCTDVSQKILHLQIRNGLSPEQQMELGKKATQRLLMEHPDVAGIIYSVDILAIGGLRAIQETGRRIPEDIQVIGIDNTLYGKICSPTLTTLDNKMVEVSQNAARLLLSALKKENITHKIMLFTNIVERESSFS